MTASFQIDQSSGAGSGVAGQSRIDLWLNKTVTLTCLSPPPDAEFLWEILYAPTGSTASITNPNSQVATIALDVNTRSFRLHLRINAGGAGADFYFILCATRDPFGAVVNFTWRTPALDEGATGNEQNEGGNVLGYVPDYDKIVLNIAAMIGEGPGPGPGGAVVTVTHANSPYAVQPTDQLIKFDYSSWDGMTGALIADLPATPTILEQHRFKNFKWAFVGGSFSPWPFINAAPNEVQPYAPSDEVSGAVVSETAINDFNGDALVIWSGAEWLLF